MDVPAKPIWSAAAGDATNGGTWAAVMAGAAPGVPPRGVVRTTWLAGSGAPFFRCAHIAFMAWLELAYQALGACGEVGGVGGQVLQAHEQAVLGLLAVGLQRVGLAVDVGDANLAGLAERRAAQRSDQGGSCDHGCDAA